MGVSFLQSLGAEEGIVWTHPDPCLGCALWMDSNAPGFIHLNRPRRNLFRNLRSALGIRIQPVVIAIEFGLVAEQPLFAHAGERRFGRDASYPGNNRRQRSPAD
jgi:hypothetical protein